MTHTLATSDRERPHASYIHVDVVAGDRNPAWLQGHWIGTMPEGPVEQFNLSPMFGHLPGFVRAVSPKNVIFYEISLIAEVGGSLSIRVKHFTAELEGWEARERYIDRPLVARDSANLYFDGVTYSQTGPDTYVVYFLNRSGAEERDTLVVPFRRVASRAMWQVGPREFENGQ